jgi:hypothetical protein
LGDSTQIVQLNPINYLSHDINIGNLSIGSGGEECNIVKLDDIALNENIKFMKIDIQGYEYFMLKGASEIIKRYKPDIFIEIEDHQLSQFGLKKQEIIDLLKSYGYCIFNIKNEYPCDYICTVNSMDKIKKLNLNLESV